jgi:hypothetical protein
VQARRYVQVRVCQEYVAIEYALLQGRSSRSVQYVLACILNTCTSVSSHSVRQNRCLPQPQHHFHSPMSLSINKHSRVSVAIQLTAQKKKNSYHCPSISTSHFHATSHIHFRDDLVRLDSSGNYYISGRLRQVWRRCTRLCPASSCASAVSWFGTSVTPRGVVPSCTIFITYTYDIGWVSAAAPAICSGVHTRCAARDLIM